MNIMYKPGSISITVKRKGDEKPFQQEREVMIAHDKNGVPLGLAYLMHMDHGETYYSITHMSSTYDVCPYWTAKTEEEVQRWIAALADLADWTSISPRVIAPAPKVLRYAVVGLIYELKKRSKARNR